MSIQSTTIIKTHHLQQRFNRHVDKLSDEITQLGDPFICFILLSFIYGSKELVQLGTKDVAGEDAAKMVFTIEDPFQDPQL